MEKALLVDVVFDMQHGKVYCDIAVSIIGQAKQNLVFRHWHYGNQLDSTSWKIESTGLKHFRTS